jgi:hypothetical protein
MYYAYMNYIQHAIKYIFNRQWTTGLLCSWGNKYRNMTLQVGGVSKIESLYSAQN